MDTRKLIYNRIAELVLTEYPDCYVTQVRSLTNRHIPCCFITQISKARVRRYATLANTDEQARLGFEVEVYAKDMTTAYAITETVEDGFKGIGFLETMCEPLESGDPSIYRIVTRFSGVAGKEIGETS